MLLFARPIRMLVIAAIVMPLQTAYGHCEDAGCDDASTSAVYHLPSFTSVASGASPVIATRLDGQPDGQPGDTGGLDPLRYASVRIQNSDGALVPTASNSFGMHASLIRVPDWIPASERPHPTAEYYLYSGGHSAQTIHMAWSDSLTGTWQRWNPLSGDEFDGRAWGENGNNTGAQTPGRGVIDMALGPESGPVVHNGTTYFPGEIFDLGDNVIEDHFSSPEVIVDDANQRIILIGHGDYRSSTFVGGGAQGRLHNSFMATSKYGLNFNLPEDGGEAGHGLRDFTLSNTYTRILQVDGEVNGQRVTQTIGLGFGGALHMAPLFTEAGDNATFANADDEGGLFNPSDSYDGTSYYWALARDTQGNSIKPMAGALRHPDVIPTNDFPSQVGGETRNGGRHFDAWYDPEVDRDTIYFFYTAAQDMPESVLMTRVSLAGLSEEERLDPANWVRIDGQEHLILKPELDWEGVNLELKPSNTGAQSNGHVLRDPHVFYDEGKLYLLYNGGGESKIGIAELTIVPEPTTGVLIGLGGHFLLACRRERCGAPGVSALIAVD